MDPNRLTPEAQLLLAEAHGKALDLGHTRVRTEHVLLAMLSPKGASLALADHLVDVAALKDAMRQALAARESGPARPAPLDPSADLEAVLADAWLRAKAAHRSRTAPGDIVSALLDEALRASLVPRLPTKGLKIKDLEKGLLEQAPGRPRSTEGGYRTLRSFSRSLTDMARSGAIEPVIGRHRELRRVMQVLCRREKSNPLLVGPPGVGKNAIVQALAQRIAAEDVPDDLKGCEIFALDVGLLQSGAEFRGMLEERLKSIVAEVRAGKGKAILFLEEIAAVVRRGSNAGDLGLLLRPALMSGDLRAIAVCAAEDYRAHVEKEPALDRLFQVVRIQEASIEETVKVLRGVRSRYEAHHGLRITDRALQAAAALGHRFVQDRRLPDKAIDLIDEAAAKVRIERDASSIEVDVARRRLQELERELPSNGAAPVRGSEELARLRGGVREADEQRELQAALGLRILVQRQRKAWGEMLLAHAATLGWDAETVGKAGTAVKQQRLALAKDEAELARLHQKRRLVKVEVDEEDVAEVVSAWTGIPLSKLMEDERAKLLAMEQALHQRVVGQEAAIVAVSNAVRLARAGMKDPNRPVGSFLFLGPTGVGKTELCRALAEFLFDDESAMVRIDMSEYMDKHTVSRLVGAPPGYIGYDDSGQLTETVRRRPYSVVLFDEIEKAHPDVFNVLLQIMEDGRLTDGHGRTVDFKNTIVTLTSNVGGHLYREHLGGLGEASPGAATRHPLQKGEGRDGDLNDRLMEALRTHFRPEFLNRLDAIVFFDLLTKEQIKDIVEIQVRAINRRLAGGGIRLQVEEPARAYLASQGYDVLQGARPLRRLIQQLVLEPMALRVLQGDVKEGDTVVIALAKGAGLGLTRVPAANGVSAHVPAPGAGAVSALLGQGEGASQE